jgi:1-acyl-sn-glycerol-3-phosphate acyltransferase
MRIVEDERPAPASDVTAAASISAAPAAPAPVDTSFDELLDPDVDLWLRDHCPTYTLPALPMMFMVDRIAAAAAHLGSGQVVAGLRDVQVNRWLICDHPRRIRTTVRPALGNDGEIEGVLLAWRDASVPALSRYEPVATGNVMLATEFPEPPAPFPPLEDAVVAADPYETGALIHGPGFHLLRELRIGASGSSAILDAGAGSIPPGALNQLLLDGITHAIPNAELHRWSEEVGEDVIAYPLRITEASFHGPTPLAGEIRCEVRFAGFDRDERRTPRFRIQLQREGTVWTEMTFVASLNPKGPIGRLDGRDRRAFIRDRLPVPDAGLSRTLDGETRLDPADVVMSDWLPGTINRLYGTDARGEELAREIAIREHIARKAGFHPSTVHLSDDGTAAHCDALPFSRFSVTVSGDEREGPLVVRDAAPERMDFAAATAYWRERLGVGGWPVEDMYFAMAEKFVRRVVLADPEAFAGIRGRSALFVANHQVAVESFLFALLNPGLTGVPSVVLAKSEVRTRWLDEYLTLAEGYPGVALPSFIIYMNQKNPLEVLETFRRCREQMARGGLSALVHIEGTRSLSCAEPVRVISSSLIDMAIDADAPIVPVRFVGGLPREPLEKRLHVPVGYGSQDYFFGRPILPEELRAVPYADRRRVVLDAINALGVSADDERPNPPDPEFQHDTREWMDSTGTDEEYSILLRALQRLREPGDEMRVILDAARDGVLRVRPDKLGAWTAELGRRLFSERGPRIERRK